MVVAKTGRKKKNEPVPENALPSLAGQEEERKIMDPIEFFRQNLLTELRGEAISRINAYLDGIIESLDWDNAFEFFNEYEKSFSNDPKVLNIVHGKFSELIEKGLKAGSDFKTIIGIHHLERYYWFNRLKRAAFTIGYIAEHLSYYSNDIGKIIQLRKARAYYRKAQSNDDAQRVQKALTEAVKAFDSVSPIFMADDNPVLQQLRDFTTKCLQDWQNENNNNRFAMLVVDFAGIRPSRYDKDSAPNDDPLLADFMTECGIIEKVNLSGSDGRVNSGGSATTREEIHNDSQEHILLTFLNCFCTPVIDWLKSKDETGSYVFMTIGGSLQEHLEWDEGTTTYFMEGLTALLSGYPQMALALWLPFFEHALRQRLSELGEDVINPKEKPGIEDFVLFENLLKKAKNHYEDRTVNYWNKILSTHNGLGWNLRNSFCHGVLPLNTLKQEVIALAVLIAFLYLAQKPVVLPE